MANRRHRDRDLRRADPRRKARRAHVLQVERDHAQLDELRSVLDEAAAQIAICERAESLAVVAVLHDGDDPKGKLDALDSAIQPLFGSIGRVALRVKNDPTTGALYEVIAQLQAIRNALGKHLAGQASGTPEETSAAVESFVRAHAKFLKIGREIVGPSERALAGARKRRSLRPVP